MQTSQGRQIKNVPPCCLAHVTLGGQHRTYRDEHKRCHRFRESVLRSSFSVTGTRMGARSRNRRAIGAPVQMEDQSVKSLKSGDPRVTFRTSEVRSSVFCSVVLTSAIRCSEGQFLNCNGNRECISGHQKGFSKYTVRRT